MSSGVVLVTARVGMDAPAREATHTLGEEGVAVLEPQSRQTGTHGVGGVRGNRDQQISARGCATHANNFCR